MTGLTDLHVQQLPYQRDSATLMHRLGSLDGAAFLDSGLGNRDTARFDILTALPTATLLQYRDRIDLIGEDRLPASLPEGLDMFGAVQWLLEQLDSPLASQGAPELAGLPFTGGAIGCFGYAARRDLVSFRHEQGPQHIPDSQIGVYHWAVIVDHDRQRSVLFFLPECARQTRQQVLSCLDTAPGTGEFRLREPFRPVMGRDRYHAAFARLKDWITAGDCYQVNLAQSFTSRYDGHPLTAYLRLRKASYSPFSAYLQLPRGAVLSLSPERFVRLRDGRALTQPIKGTQPRNQDPAIDEANRQTLLDSEKDRAENLMIVDLLRNDFGSICETGSVAVEALFELHSFSNVHHLISTVTGELAPANPATALLRACFPGGSITGAPKIRAMQIIDELEPVPRTVYCGSIAWLGFNGDMDSNIGIRTLLCDGENIYCWGGGGIVADSQCDLEYQESIDKISNLINELEQ